MILFYLLKVSACTLIFFAAYKLLLGKLTFFKLNRFYLLGSILLSFSIPALNFTIEKEIVVKQVLQASPIGLGSEGNTGIVQIKEMSTESTFDWLLLIPFTYWAVAFSILSFGLYRVYQLIKFTKADSNVYDGLKIISKTSGFTNCSFFNYVFIDETNLSNIDLQVLLKHESVHAAQYHSIDKLIMMIAKALLWFNPIVYFFDKALEQTHEYEADEAASQSFGNNAYASLLLRLAVSKNEMPLIHNFVKSPIKERIKMLFNSKSKGMKKLTYVLALPITIGLVWLFGVQVVYAQTKQNSTFDIKPNAKVGEIVKGEIIKIENIVVGNVFELSANGKTYSIEANSFSHKLKIGDGVIVSLSGIIENFKKTNKEGVVIGELKTPVYLSTKITDYDGKLIYERKSEKYAFGFEVNKARYANSKITSIKKNSDGTFNKIVLNDGYFTINLNLNGQNLKQDNFKVGDEVVVKFIGEKQIAKNTYSTNKLIILYAESKRYEVKNEALYNRFYFKDGRQKVAAVNVSDPRTIIPQITSSSKTGGNIADKTEFNLENETNKTFNSSSDVTKQSSAEHGLSQKNLTNDKIEYSASDSVRYSKDKSIISLYGKAKIYLKDITIEADEITFNQKANTGSAKNLVLTSKSGSKIKGSNASFNLDGKVEIWQNVRGNVIVEP